MAFINGTNQGRVQKMLENLGLIEKSAEANKVAAAEIVGLPQPILARLALYQAPAAPATDDFADLLGDRPTADAHRGPMPKVDSHRYYNNVRQLCEEADLEALSLGMSIFMDRVHEKLTA